MEYTEALKTIGRLVRNGRLEMDTAQQPFARDAGVDLKTLRTLETGDRAPRDTTLIKIEAALGWRQGVIREVLDHHAIIPVTSVTLDYLREGAQEATWLDLAAEEERNLQPVRKASLLSNEEIIGELLYRLRHEQRGISPDIEE